MIWLQTIFGLRRSAAAEAGSNWLLERNTFHAFLERERMRTDRNQSVFSLLVISHPAGNGDQDIAQFEEVLRGRIRQTDIAGWFDSRRIGVILPDTGSSGAYTLARDLSKRLGETQPTHDFDIYTHPAEVTDSDSHHDDSHTDASPDTRGSDGDEHVAGDRRMRGSRQPSVASIERIDVAAPSTVGVHVFATGTLESLLLARQPAWKRALDIVGALAGLLLLSPLLLLTAIAIRFSSPGPILFAQRREGLGGRIFTMYKFRTMCTDAEALKASLRALSEQDGPAFKLTNDPRVTPLGRFLRRTCIDELPQLWNVLRGEMSLVGPRPLPVDESRRCKPWQRRRLAVKPGLTCIWQVDGGVDVTFDEWMRMDLQYAASRTPVQDVRLLWKTFTKVLMRRASR